MHKENRGFTLLELIISIAVLSIMAGVLFQAFVVSRRIDTKAAKEERVQSLAKGVMEDMKGVAFGEIGNLPEEDAADTSGTVTVGGHVYTYETLAGSDTETEGEDSGAGYLLKREHRISAAPDAKADYLIEVEADAKRYKSTAEGDSDSSYSINNYKMPNIADVSSFQNIVLSPDMMIRDDGIKVSELLEKVNPEEADESDAAGEPLEAAVETVYDVVDVKKALCIEIQEKKPTDDAEGRLLVGAYGIYTVEEIPDTLGAIAEELSVTFPMVSFKKQITLDKKTGKPLNRIYLFLPAETAVKFEKIYVDSDMGSTFEHPYELYVIASGTTSETEEDYIVIGETETSGIHLLTNLEAKKPVSLHEPQDRLYGLRVTVYEASYGAGGSSAEPVKGKALLTLDSTKSE